jgi:phosphoribosylformylglycinamidine (FGAM) synthase-like enzyme
VLAARDLQRYDGVVRGTTAMPPGYADAGVIVPIPGAPLGVALAVGRQPALREARSAAAAELAVLEASQRHAVGARRSG